MVDINKINYCKPGMMSECTAKNIKECKYYKSSSTHSRCMFQSIELSNGYHCGCVDAQYNARGDQKEIIEEMKDSELPT